MVGTFWAFVPAIIAIVLALATKQVYLSLFAGIFLGAMFLASGNPIEALNIVFENMGAQLGNNGGILVFLVVLGIFAVLMVKSGGSQAYGDWASKKIKTQTGAQLATIGLGCLIFVDDYFNCLTVGNAMRPVTDKYKISRAKFAYLIDSTAAPICIIAPISSWAAAVAGFLPDDRGLVDFIMTIPLNVYALVTVAMMVVFVLLKLDFFKMKRNAVAANNGDLLAGENELPTEDIKMDDKKTGKVAYLLVPVLLLIVCCIVSMYYSGYRNGYPKFTEAFANCSSGTALAVGSVIALVITMVYLIIAKAMSFKECMGSFTEGFKSMVPAILILTFAWTLCALMGAKGEGLDASGAAIADGTLNAKAFIQRSVNPESIGMGVLPAVFFIMACLISFATGTSWGTFGTLIPIVITVLSGSGEAIIFLTMSAVLAGAVYGDHVSPISDTTIMASAGAPCNHLDHVRTQLPYATIVAIICFITYLCSGFATASGKVGYGGTVAITLSVSAILFATIVTILYMLDKKGVLDKIHNKMNGFRFFKKMSADGIDGKITVDAPLNDATLTQDAEENCKTDK